MDGNISKWIINKKKTCEKASLLQNSVPKQVPSVENSKK